MPLGKEDVARLESQKWHERPEFKGVPTTAPYPGGRQLAKRSDGACVFLQEDGLCLIHKEFGFAAKPLICRMFPLQLIPHEKQAVLTLRRACPSAAADKGQPLTEQLTDAQAYAWRKRAAGRSLKAIASSRFSIPWRCGCSAGLPSVASQRPTICSRSSRPWIGLKVTRRSPD